MKNARRLIALFVCVLFIFVPLAAPQSESGNSLAETLKGLEYRAIGPFRGGRVTAVAGVPGQRNVYYFGSTGGGVWKTTDAGRNWSPISDKFFNTGSVGAIGIAESNPNVIYVGMGESPVRGNVSHGDGVYKSTDAGKTWKHVGLDDTRHIGRVRVHPQNPDLVYVAAMGHLFGPNEQRGIFRSKDGGETWEKVLYRNPDTGVVDLAMDPNNANVLYAGLWQVRRTPYSLESGGEGSGIFKTTDGGDTWEEISRDSGLPKGLLGKICVTVSPVNSERVWAMVEAEEGGLFRSDDSGETWRRVSADRNLRQRAWYYSRVYADTQDLNTVYVLNVAFHKSTDGGSTFTTIGVPHGDNHDLWIDPEDSQRLIESNDGGANVTADGGDSWTEQDQPTAQFYRVALDTDFPYNVYGAQQDNSTVRTASRASGGGIADRDWWPVGGGESGWIAPHPNDSNIVFAGSYGGYLSRYDHRTGQNRNITVWPDNPMGYGAEGMKYRFQWNFPILFSPHDPNTLYAGSNILFKTTNEGQTWQPISPDLTRNDPSKLGPSGGPITKDNTGVEYYATIFTAMASPIEKGTIWVGSDDGLVHVTRNGGGRWQNVTPADIPEWIQINSIEASPHDPATAYVAATMYKSDDFRPYLYKTTDYGKTWRKIVNGIPDNAFTRVIREDPHQKGLLYAGTETGMYVSFDDGARWESLRLNLPVVPITDLAIHKRDKDLVVATQGRAFWILDDLPLLYQWSDEVRSMQAHLFTPEDAYRFGRGRGGRRGGGSAGQNPASGAVVYYWLKEKPEEEVTLEFSGPDGMVIRSFSSQPSRGEGDRDQAGDDDEGGGRRGRGSGATKVSVEPGLNKFEWDMQHEDAVGFPGMILWSGSLNGPQAAPGAYSVKLTVNGESQEQKFAYLKDPRLAATQEDFDKQLALLLQIRDKLTETHRAILRIRDARGQVEGLAGRVKGRPEAEPIEKAAKDLAAKLTAIEEELYQTKNQSRQDPLNFPIKLNNKLAALAGVVASADAAPTDQSYQVHEDLATRINAQLRSLDGVMSKDLEAFNQLVREKNVPAVLLKSSEEGR